MSKPFTPGRLPGRTVEASLTVEVGREVLGIEAIPVAVGDVVLVRFESTNSPRRQGIWLAAQGKVRVLSEAAQVQLWSDAAPNPVSITIVETDGLLRFYNVYERPSGEVMSQMNGTGMIRTDRDDGWIEYACNDVGMPPAFDRLVFSIKAPGTKQAGGL